MVLLGSIVGQSVEPNITFNNDGEPKINKRTLRILSPILSLNLSINSSATILPISSVFEVIKRLIIVSFVIETTPFPESPEKARIEV